MDAFVARQAIFDRGLIVQGYELLFRSGPANTYSVDGPAVDGTAATTSVIANGFFSMGFGKLLHGRRAFINFDRALLLGDLGGVLPPNTVIEVLETVEPDDEVLAACRAFRAGGYEIAMDDYTGDPRLDPLVELAGIIKVDVRQASREKQVEIISRWRGKKTLLAEKVETREEYAWACNAGYDLFQGFFFAEPVMVGAQQVPATAASALGLVKAMRNESLDFDEVERLIKREIGFSHRLLLYLNSPLFHFAGAVSSIRQALALMGEHEIRRWVMLATFSRLGTGKPPELVKQSMIRGRFCEIIGKKLPRGSGGAEIDVFLTGVFSLLPALLDRSMVALLEEMSLASELAAALRGDCAAENVPCAILRLVRAWESGDWETATELAGTLHLSTEEISQAYLHAVEWADETATDPTGASNTRSAIHGS